MGETHILRVHIKMKSLSSCWRMSVTKELTSIKKKKKILLWKSMVSINCLVTNILQNIFFCVQQKIEIHTGLEQLEGE